MPPPPPPKNTLRTIPALIGASEHLEAYHNLPQNQG